MCKKCRLHLAYTSLPSIHFSSHSELYVFNVSFVKLNVTMLSCHAVMGFCTCMQKEQMWPPCSQSPWGRLHMQILQNPWSKCPKTLKFTGIFFSCRLYSLTSLTLTSKEESTVEAAVAQTTQNVHMLSKSSWQSALRWCSVQTTSRTWLNGCSYSASLCLKGWEEKDSKHSLFISAHEVHPTIKKLFKEQWLWSILDIKRGSALFSFYVSAILKWHTTTLLPGHSSGCLPHPVYPMLSRGDRQEAADLPSGLPDEFLSFTGQRWHLWCHRCQPGGRHGVLCYCEWPFLKLVLVLLTWLTSVISVLYWKLYSTAGTTGNCIII